MDHGVPADKRLSYHTFCSPQPIGILELVSRREASTLLWKYSINITLFLTTLKRRAYSPLFWRWKRHLLLLSTLQTSTSTIVTSTEATKVDNVNPDGCIEGVREDKLKLSLKKLPRINFGDTSYKVSTRSHASPFAHKLKRQRITNIHYGTCLPWTSPPLTTCLHKIEVSPRSTFIGETEMRKTPDGPRKDANFLINYLFHFKTLRPYKSGQCWRKRQYFLNEKLVTSVCVHVYRVRVSPSFFPWISRNPSPSFYLPFPFSLPFCPLSPISSLKRIKVNPDHYEKSDGVLPSISR